jgi:hypothetical protein
MFKEFQTAKNIQIEPDYKARVLKLFIFLLDILLSFLLDILLLIIILHFYDAFNNFKLLLLDILQYFCIIQNIQNNSGVFTFHYNNDGYTTISFIKTKYIHDKIIRNTKCIYKSIPVLHNDVDNYVVNRFL